MTPIFTQKDSDILSVKQTGYSLLSNPLLNKGMAFTLQERLNFNLLGLLPPKLAGLKEQCTRCYEAYLSKQTDLDKYLFLSEIQDTNETLFYALLCRYIEEMMPIIYTPTVGLGCQTLSHIYRRPRGLYISYQYINYIDKALDHPRFKNTRVIVVSDGERILGLGDQGAGGMGIPIGKLMLYTVCAGIHPNSTLPILLDTGTDNPSLLNDPLYIGWGHKRIRGRKYSNFIDIFVQAVKKRFPHVVLQWEDFAQKNANFILNKYRNDLCTFNDDIQGTATVVAGTILAAIKKLQQSIIEQRIVIVGAGAAGCGICHLLNKLMHEKGLSNEEAQSHFFLVDKQGLLVEGSEGILPFQKRFVTQKNIVSSWQSSQLNGISLETVIKNVHPTILIGTAGHPGIFTEAVVREMAAHTQHPIIFPLSNPPSKSEAEPKDLNTWTEKRAIIGAGSPFVDSVNQVNNSYIFPGVGLGLITAGSKVVTDNHFLAAAKALAACSSSKRNHDAPLLPPLTKIREVSLKIALAVAKESIHSGLTELDINEEKLEALIKQNMWIPKYRPYKRA